VSRPLRWLLGPELYWLAVYGASRLISNPNVGADADVNLRLERLCWAVPLVTVPLSFALFYRLLPRPSSRAWLTARLAMATFVGLNASLFRIVDAIDYGDTRNAGVLGFWMIGLMLGGLLWIVGCGTVLLTARRGRAA
jgi:hypothetical protein